MFGHGGALVISLAAILKAAGSLTGWMLIVAQSAQAAAVDGMFPRAFASTNDHGMPVRNLVITGLMMTGLLMLTISPDVATQFYRITNATVVLMSIPYVYSVVSMWRLNATHRHAHRQAPRAARHRHRGRSVLRGRHPRADRRTRSQRADAAAADHARCTR